MNVEIFNAICTDVSIELQRIDLIAHLKKLTSHMQSMISQPQTPQHQQDVSNLKATIISQLKTSKSNDYSPFWKENLKEIGFDGLLGNELADTIESIFNENQITISVAHSQLAAISQKLSTLSTTITQIVQNLKTLNIKSEHLEKGQSEFVALIPRIAIKEDVKQFSDEILETKRIIDDFNELIIGSRPAVKLKTIASSDFCISLDMLPQVAFGLLSAINLIIITYQSILEIRKSHQELKKQGVPDENLKGVEDYANQKMADSISTGVNELITKYAAKMDAGRKSELSISLTMSLNKLSNRIDNGYNFDVRFSEDKLDDQANETEEAEKREQIQDMSRNLEFMNLTGEKILCLPEKESS
jgi:hypothetical protein